MPSSARRLPLRGCKLPIPPCYFASELPGYYDEYDEYVYEWARSRFVRDIQNLTGWRCAMERWEDGDRLACAE